MDTNYCLDCGNNESARCVLDSLDSGPSASNDISSSEIFSSTTTILNDTNSKSGSLKSAYSKMSRILAHTVCNSSISSGIY